VPAGDLFQLFGGAGAGVVGVSILIAVLFITGQLATKKQLDDADKRLADMRDERDEWRRTAELERARSEAGVVTGQIVRDVMISLRKELK
jgi:hypothetical protein